MSTDPEVTKIVEELTEDSNHTVSIDIIHQPADPKDFDDEEFYHAVIEFSIDDYERGVYSSFGLCLESPDQIRRLGNIFIGWADKMEQMSAKVH
jgi:hypothetical protein